MPSITRRKAVNVNIGGVVVGSGAPVVVQSMTNTDTADVESTIQQIAALARAGVRYAAWIQGCDSGEVSEGGRSAGERDDHPPGGTEG